MARRFCLCDCHAPYEGDFPFAAVGMDPLSDSDVADAALACDSCRNWHSAIFLTPAAPRLNAPTAAERELAWAAYEQELARRNGWHP